LINEGGRFVKIVKMKEPSLCEMCGGKQNFTASERDREQLQIFGEEMTGDTQETDGSRELYLFLIMPEHCVERGTHAEQGEREKKKLLRGGQSLVGDKGAGTQDTPAWSKK